MAYAQILQNFPNLKKIIKSQLTDKNPGAKLWNIKQRR